MVLRTKSGKSYQVGGDSTGYVFLLRLQENELANATQFMAYLTDEELELYSLSDLTGEHSFTYGHFSAMNLEKENDHYVAKYYIVRRVKTPDDMMKVIEKLQKELDESDRALGILFGEEDVHDEIGESTETQTDN